jgi:hypothetical protein
VTDQEVLSSLKRDLIDKADRVERPVREPAGQASNAVPAAQPPPAFFGRGAGRSRSC